MPLSLRSLRPSLPHALLPLPLQITSTLYTLPLHSPLCVFIHYNSGSLSNRILPLIIATPMPRLVSMEANTHHSPSPTPLFFLLLPNPPHELLLLCVCRRRHPNACISLSPFLAPSYPTRQMPIQRVSAALSTDNSILPRPTRNLYCYHRRYLSKTSRSVLYGVLLSIQTCQLYIVLQ